MLYTVIRSSIKFNVILRPRVFGIFETLFGGGERPLPEEGLKPEPTSSLIFGAQAHFLLEARKKWRSEGRGCIFLRSPMVLIIAFPTCRVPPATWSSSFAARI
jgi:hypothetical protein